MHLIFWGSNWNTSGATAKQLLLNFYDGLSGSAYQGILTQYFGPGHISSTVGVDSYIDTSVPAPTQLTDGANTGPNDVQTEITTAIAANGWPQTINDQFVVLPAPGSTYDQNFTGNFCSYHGVSAVPGPRYVPGVVYVMDPYDGDPPFDRCALADPNDNPDRSTSMIASHEYAEAATDPFSSAWSSQDSAEIADLCQFGGEVVLPGGAYAQRLWDNYQNECSVSDPNRAVTGSAGEVARTSATLHGTVNPQWLVTNYHFEYGMTTSYGQSTPSVALDATWSDQDVAQDISDLQPQTTYHFRLIATGSAGTTYGGDMTFMTLPHPPVTATGAASAITQTTATLGATVNPQSDQLADCHFDYGPTSSYSGPGSGTVACLPAAASIPVDSSDHAVSADPSGLTPNTAYHYRIVVATTENITVNGQDMTFSTPPNPPIAATGAASAITQTTATLGATVNPQGAATIGGISFCVLEWGTDTTYSAGSAACSPDPSGASVDSAISVDATGLAASTLYHFRVVVNTPGGASNGTDQIFATLSPPPPPPPNTNPVPVPRRSKCKKGFRVLVNYRRSGGVGGNSAHLIVTRGGHARVTTPLGTSRALLSSTMRARLTRVLRRANFTHLKSDYEPSTPVPDAFAYTITHSCRTVRTVDTAVPSRLQAVISLLDQIIAKLSR